MNAHTPGPWIVNPLLLSQVGSVAGALPMDVAFATGGKPHEEIAANARLIAAAPELLKVLRIAVRQNSHDMLMTGEELRSCEAVIAKATGSTHV